MNIKATMILLAAATGLQACGQDGNVDIGKNGVSGASLTDYADQWEGYTEATQLVFGSDRFRFRLNGDGTGTVVLGESQVYPPATDPNVGYPTDEDQMTAAVKVDMFRPGFEYPVHDVTVESKRIRFKVVPYDFYKGWCELQTPVESLSQKGVYFCGPNSLSQTSPGVCVGGDGTRIDCNKGLLCGRFICQCTAAGCTSGDTGTTIFDGALYDQGTRLQGTFGTTTVRMERK